MAKTIRVTTLALALVLAPALARAQLGIYQAHTPAVGERYYVEFSFGYWDPSPGINISSNALQVVGTQIDGVTDLGFTQKKVPDLHFILRPARKHKIKFEYLPVSYSADAIVTRTITFQGHSYPLGVPVTSSLDWKTYRFGYEYDIVYRDRGFLGVTGTIEYVRVQANLRSPFASGALDDRTPVPAVGATARVYPARNFALTGEFGLFKLVKSTIANVSGTYVDYDLYGTLNFTDNVGVQGGYRSRDVTFDVTDAWGRLKLRGLYFRGVVRF